MEEKLPRPTLSAFRKSQYDPIPLTYRKAVSRVVEKERLSIHQTKSSHVFMQHSDGRATVISVHSGESIGPGLLTKILKDVDTTKDDSVRSRRKSGNQTAQQML